LDSWEEVRFVRTGLQTRPTERQGKHSSCVGNSYFVGRTALESRSHKYAGMEMLTPTSDCTHPILPIYPNRHSIPEIDGFNRILDKPIMQIKAMR
jgi:hypothetical protein